MAAKVMMIEELHQRMGHISPEAARCLVSEGAIEGIKIDKSSQLWSCDSCEYTKATWKPIRPQDALSIRIWQRNKFGFMGAFSGSDTWKERVLCVIYRQLYTVDPHGIAPYKVMLPQFGTV